MPLIRNGAVVEDAGTSVTLAQFIEAPDLLLERDPGLAVRLAPGDDPLALQPFLDRLAVIEVAFPKYTDGRGYSQAQILRRRLGYGGELRAVGHVLRDQLLYMHRSGFDAYATSRASLASLLDAMGEFSLYYQPAADGARHVFAARHAAKG